MKLEDRARELAIEIIQKTEPELIEDTSLVLAGIREGLRISQIIVRDTPNPTVDKLMTIFDDLMNGKLAILDGGEVEE